MAVMTETDVRTENDVETENVPQTGRPDCAHIVKVGPGETATAKVLEARVMGTPLEALCGHVWVPSRDPKSLPLCEDCKNIYEMYKSFNDGLNDTPGE
ncbi:MAG: DUF3039 domain-containing protein [Actinomycetota bacterium]